MDRAFRQSVHGKRFGQRIDQTRKMLFGPTLMVALSPVGRDQCAQQAPRFGRPGDVGLVDVPPPRCRVVASGREAEDEREHLLISDT